MSRAAPTSTPPPTRKPVNLSIDTGLLWEARSHGINVSAFLEQALAVELKRLRRLRWLAENRAAIDSYNADVHRNPNVVTQGRYPLLLDVQPELLVELATREVIPMSLVDEHRRPAFQALTPICRVGDRDYVVMTPMLAGIPERELGAPVADLSGDGPSIIAAIELLVKGL